jgi:hypothetical protein
MKRKDFIKQVGIGAAIAITFPCITSSCKKKDDNKTDNNGSNYSYTPATNIDFTIDLNSTEGAPLKKKGGYVVKNDVVVARTKTDEYIAASLHCSDENLKSVTYDGDEWYCTEHDATYSNNGAGTQTYNNLGEKGITTYNTELTGTILRIFSK